MNTKKGIFITKNSVQSLSISDNIAKFGSEQRNVNEFWEKGLHYAMPNFCSFTMNLPDGIKYINYTNNSIYALIEMPPQYRNININHCKEIEAMRSIYKSKNKDNNEIKDVTLINRFNLFLPYVLFFFNIYISDHVELSIGAYMDNKPFVDIRNKVYHLPFMNINRITNQPERNEICMGFDDKDYINLDKSNSIREIVEYSLNKFWSNTFNNDYLSALNVYNNSFYNNYYEWEETSKTNPNNVLTEMNNFKREVDLSKIIGVVNLDNFNKHESRMFDLLLSGQPESLYVNKFLENFPSNEYSSNYNREFTLYSEELKREFIWYIGEEIIVDGIKYVIDDYIFDKKLGTDMLVLRDKNNQSDNVIKVNHSFWSTEVLEDICLKKLETEMEVINKIKIGKKYMTLEPGSIISLNYDEYQLFYKIKKVYLDRDKHYMITLDNSNFRTMMLPLDIPEGKIHKVNVDSINYNLDQSYKIYSNYRNLITEKSVIYKGVKVSRVGQLNLLFKSEEEEGLNYIIPLEYDIESKTLHAVNNNSNNYTTEPPIIKEGAYKFKIVGDFDDFAFFVLEDNNNDFVLSESKTWVCKSPNFSKISLHRVMKTKDINLLIRDDCLFIPFINGNVVKVKKGDIIIRLNKEYRVLDFISENDKWFYKLQPIDDPDHEPILINLFDSYIYNVIPFEKNNMISKSVIIRKTSSLRITNVNKKDRYKIKYNIVNYHVNPSKHYYHVDIITQNNIKIKMEHSVVENYFDLVV